MAEEIIWAIGEGLLGGAIALVLVFGPLHIYWAIQDRKRAKQWALEDEIWELKFDSMIRMGDRIDPPEKEAREILNRLKRIDE